MDRAIAEADGILETFSALLRIAPIEAGSWRAGFRSVDLAEATRTVIDVFEPAAEDQRHRLSGATPVPSPGTRGMNAE